MNLDPFYRDLYEEFSRPAVLAVIGDSDGGATLVSLKVIDLTKGVQRPSATDPAVMTVLPIAHLRRSDLLAAAIDPNDLDGAGLELNDKQWRVTAWGPRPNANGEDTGEIEVILTKLD